MLSPKEQLLCMKHNIKVESKTPELRKVSINGLTNARDLGGLKVGDDNLTNFKVVIRGESPQLITQEGATALEKYNITDIVDLRSNYESKSLGYGHVSNLKIHSAPMLDDSSFIDNVGARLGRKYEYENYLNQGRESFKILFDAINNAVGAVYLHCAVGKDRTGVVSSIMLMALGVSKEDIVDDYLYSTHSVKTIIPALANNGVYDDFSKPNWNYQIPVRSDMDHIVQAIGGQVGAVNYLTSCNISSRDLGLFRERFLS